MRRLPLLAAFALLLSTPTARAGLLGAEFDAAYYFHTLAPPYGGATFTPPSFTVVDTGAESTLNVENLTFISVDFTDNQLILTYDRTTANPPTWGSDPINGPAFKLAATSPLSSLGITGFTVDPSTTLVGFNASMVTVTDTEISINWGGLTYAAGNQVVIDLAFVPEPSSIIALGAGCVLPVVATLRRRRRRAAA